MRIYVNTLKRSALMVSAATALALGPVFLSPAAAAGGSFSAGYGGQFKIVSCTPNLPCTVNLGGLGIGSFIGASKEGATLKVKITIPCSPTQGSIQLTSTTSSTNVISAVVGGTICLQTPITKGLAINLGYLVKGGTGIFAHATGTGTITGTAILKAGTYTDSWKGTLNY